MRTTRLTRGLLLLAATTALVLPSTVKSFAAEPEDEDPVDGVGRYCPAALTDATPSQLHWRLDPPAGGDVAPGQAVTVSVTWDPALYAGSSQLRRAIACISFDDVLQPVLSGEERPTANDGVFEHRFEVPSDARDGARVCGLGVTTGGPHGAFKQEKSDSGCLTVKGTAASPTPNATRVSDLCPTVLTGPSTGNAKLAGNVPAGGEVQGGQSVEMALTWRSADFVSEKLDKAAHCVTVNGALDTFLSVVDAPAANDGAYPLTFTAPSGLASATLVCDRAFIQGEGLQSPTVSERSDEVCFSVVPLAVETISAAVPAPVTSEDSLSGVEGFCPAPIENKGHPFEQTANVARDAVVHPGDVIEVSFRWQTGDFAALSRVGACLRVDNKLDARMSMEERPAANDGTAAHRFTVPEGLADGARICSRGYGAGADGEKLRRVKSTEICFRNSTGTTGALARAAAAEADADVGDGELSELPRTGFAPRALALGGAGAVGAGCWAFRSGRPRRSGRRRLAGTAR